MITALTGITDAMVRGAPRFREVAPALVEALRGRVFVAHNAPFDWRFVSARDGARAPAASWRAASSAPCGWRASSFPQLPSRSLDSLAHYFGLEIEARHRALDDARGHRRSVLLRFFDLLEDREVTTGPGCEALLARSARRAGSARGLPPLDGLRVSPAGARTDGTFTTHTESRT